jgi:hypothetical protein
MNTKTNSVCEDGIYIVGTTNACAYVCTSQESPVSAIITCNSDNQTTTLTQVENPRIGSFYPFFDPLQNTTDFKKDKSSDLLQYQSTSNLFDYFRQTFPTETLSENQLYVASTALFLHDMGRNLCVITCSDEVELIALCKKQKWLYRVVDSFSSNIINQ